MPNKSSIKSKKSRKFRIVLDSAFAKTNFFPSLSKRAKVFHCVYDFGLSKQASDKDIYQKAFENKCFVLTVNFNDFRKLLKEKGPGVLGIESQLTTEDMDKKVANFLKGKNPEDCIGKAIKI